jgi:hypothetical protein
MAGHILKTYVQDSKHVKVSSHLHFVFVELFFFCSIHERCSEAHTFPRSTISGKSIKYDVAEHLLSTLRRIYYKRPIWVKILPFKHIH